MATSAHIGAYTPRASIGAYEGSASTDRYWVGADSSWNTATNWAYTSGGAGLATVPGATNDVVFDDGDVTDCTIDVNATCLSLTFGAGAYTGTLDADTFDVAIGTGGLDCTGGGSATLDLGTGTWTCSGIFDSQDLGTCTNGTAKIVLDAATGHHLIKSCYDLEVNAACSFNLAFTVDNLLKLTAVASVFKVVSIGGSLEITATGEKAGSSAVWLLAGADVTDMSGTWSAGELRIYTGSGITQLAAGTIGADVLVFHNSASAGTVQLQGAFQVSGAFGISSFNGSGVTWDMNNQSLTLQGNVTLTENTGTITWTAGSGTITLSGTSTQAIDFLGKAVEDLSVTNTAGLVTFASSFTTDSYTQAQNADIAGAITITCAAGGSVDINGTAGNVCAVTDTDFAVSGGGTADADYTTLTDSTCTGATGDATNNCVEVGTCTGWNFGGVVAIVNQFQFNNLGVDLFNGALLGV